MEIKLNYCFVIVAVIIAQMTTSCNSKRIPKKVTYLTNPKNKIETNQDQIYWELVKGNKNIDWSRLDGTLEFIKNEYDCSDFRLVNLIRIMYQYEDQVPAEYKTKIENVLFNFRYWLDEPDGNSMCYWTENHQILFASSEFLVGQKYPNTIFPNSGLTGKQHMDKAKKRIQDWLLMRWDYGFTEFYSNVYYKEDVGALMNLIDLAESKEIAVKSEIILDLLFYDVASQSTKNMFISTSGRAYERNRKGGIKYTFGGVTDYYWGNEKEVAAGMMFGLVETKKYKIPAVLKEIAQDSATVIIKQRNGLTISDLKTEGYYGKDMRSLMMQWGMGAFVNPSVVRNSLSNIRKYNMLSNAFLKDFKQLDNPILSFLHLEPLAIKIINPPFLGTAIQKANTYTYRTNDYSIYTTQNYHAGGFADQFHVFGVNISNQFAVFHCHPATEKDSKASSPNYWEGYGRLPESAQDKNINLSIYNIPKKKGMMEKKLLDYTHAYFPKEQFDEIELKDNYIFGKKGNTYCVFIATNPLSFREGTKDDVIQKGKQVFWITEVSSKNVEGSFENFMSRIKSNKIVFNSKKLELHYNSNGKSYELKYKGEFKLDGGIIDTNYSRFDAPYVQSESKGNTIRITKNGKSLYLDFENLIRELQ